MAEPAIQDHQLQIERVAASVRLKVGPLDDARIEQAVRDAFQLYESATIRQYVPVLVERAAVSRLRASQPAEPAIPDPAPGA